MVEARQDMDFYQAGYLFLDKLTKTDLKVYHAVGELGHDTACKAYQHEIAAQANLNPRQVRCSLARLVSVGLLERSGGRYCAVYRFIYPKRRDKIDPSRVVGGDGYTKREDKIDPSHVVGHDGYTKREDKIDPSGSIKGGGYTKREDKIVPSDNSTTTTTTTTTKKPISQNKQLTLISNEDDQNFRAIDIDPQAMIDFATLEINCHIKQTNKHAPDGLRGKRAADCARWEAGNEAFRNNLARWAEVSRAGRLKTQLPNGKTLTPVLMLWQIFEGQPPPLLPEDEPGPPILTEAGRILAESSNPTAQAGKPSPDELLTALSEKPPIPPPQTRPDPESPPDSGAETEEEQLWPETLAWLVIHRGKIPSSFDESYLANVTLTETCTCYTIAVKDKQTADCLNRQWQRPVVHALTALTSQPSHQIEVNFVAGAPRPALPVIPLPASRH